MEKTRNWMVRCGRGSHKIDDFLRDNIIAVGWGDIGEIQKGTTYEELKETLNKIYPDWTSGKISQSAGQLWRFFSEFEIENVVLTYDSSNRFYYIGKIVGEYFYDDTKEEYKHCRKVEWTDYPIYRDDLTVETKNILGSILTIFEIDSKTIQEIREAHPAYVSDEEMANISRIEEMFEKQQQDAMLSSLKDEAIEKSTEFVKDMISNLSWEDLENLVAALFQAMGYKTRMTSRGSDGGYDILASPDGLGMIEPRIKIEVKKRSKEKIGAPEIRNFLGGLRTNEKGVFICTGGFSKEARYESERANFSLTLIDSDYFVDLILEHYENLSLEAKAILPLKRIYWPLRD